MKNALSVDVEDWFQVGAFEKVIARDAWETLPRRVERNTDRVLALCDTALREGPDAPTLSDPWDVQDLLCHLLVRERKAKSISYSFRFWNLTANPVEEVARGVVTIVCVAHARNGKMSAVPIPEEIAKLIEVAPPELLV